MSDETTVHHGGEAPPHARHPANQTASSSAPDLGEGDHMRKAGGEAPGTGVQRPADATAGPQDGPIGEPPLGGVVHAQ